MDSPSTEPPVDWRGTPITPGALVIYGAPVGRSIAMVEAIVSDPMLSPSGRIWLDVQRRAYGGGRNVPARVHLGADRLTVVDALPPTTRLTERERADRVYEQQERRLAWMSAYHDADPAGHDVYANGHCRTCWLEGGRFDEAWEAGRPLDEPGHD